MIDLAKEDYLKGMKYKDIAEKYNVSINTVKSWVKRHGWSAEKKGCTQKKKGAHEKKSTPEVKEVIENTDLTEKQKLFCLYYLKNFNATKAYQKAYMCGYNTANAEGYKLLVNPCVKQQIEKLKAERMQQVYLSTEDILQRYIDIAFSDVTDFVEFGTKEEPICTPEGEPILDTNGEPILEKVSYLKFKDADEVDGRLINQISLGKSGASIKLEDRQKALDFLAKLKGLHPEFNLKKELAIMKQNEGSKDTRDIKVSFGIPRPDRTKGD